MPEVKHLTQRKTSISYLNGHDVATIYNYLFHLSYKNPNFWLEYLKEQKRIDKFLQYLYDKYSQSSIAIPFIVNYFFFQFGYWIDKESRYDIKLDWVIGVKALERFFNRTKEQEYACISKLQKEKSISLYKTLALFSKKEDNEKYNDNIRKSKTGKARLYNCYLNGVEFSIKSPVCLNCVAQKDCKKYATTE